jgi:cell shape-determining protein MreC
MNTILNLIEGLKMKIEALEKLSHEPQNYKDKCDEMEKRLVKLESIITEMTNENKKPT